MGIAEVLAFFKALPELVSILRDVVDALKQLKQDAIDKELQTIKNDVNETLTKIEGAKSNEERKNLSMELAKRMSL